MRNPVFLVVYFRYFRFFPDGTLLYCTTPEILRNVGRTMRDMPTAPLHKEDCRMVGKYVLKVGPLARVSLFDLAAVMW